MFDNPGINRYWRLHPFPAKQHIDQTLCSKTLANHLIFLNFNRACLNCVDFHSIPPNKRIFFPNPGSTKMFPSSKAVLPRKTTFLTLPLTFQPSNGVQPQRVNCSEARTSYSALSSTSIHVSD